MAKLGNEASLILRLIVDKMEENKRSRYQTISTEPATQASQVSHKAGYDRAINDLKVEINTLKTQLESGIIL